MKRDITQEELEEIEINYPDKEKMINMYKKFIDYTNCSRFRFRYPYNRFGLIGFFKEGRFESYMNGIIEDTNLESNDTSLDFAIEIMSIYLSGNSLIKFYSFAVKNDFDLRVLNGEEKLFVYFKRLGNKEERKKWEFSKLYSLGRYALGKNYCGEDLYFYPKDVRLYFENLIEKINYNCSALLIKNHFDQNCIGDLIGDCERYSVLGKTKLNKLDKDYLRYSSIFNFIQPIIDTERGYHWRYTKGDIDDEFIVKKDGKYEEVERIKESKIEEFIVSYIEDDGRIKANSFKDSYKKQLLHPLPFQMIDYQYLLQREYDDRIIYIYRLSTFVDSYILHQIFGLYYIMQLFIDLRVNFLVKPINSDINKRYDDLLKTIKCNNPYLCTLFSNLPYTDEAEDDIGYYDYNYNEEYINFFFYIIESKNKKTLDSDSYFAEVEESRRQDELDREAREREEEYKRENENFIK